jgi:electron transport complex protein RnfE
MLVLIASNTTVSLIRQWVAKEIRIPVFVMVIASFVTCIQLLMNAFTYGLYQNLGIFIPLIVTNCIIIGRAEAFAARNEVKPAAFDGLMMGLGFTIVLMVVGAIRELLGNGSLFYGIELLLGDWASFLYIQVVDFNEHFLVAILPPGAFLVMGFIIAIKNIIDNRVANKQQAVIVSNAENSQTL